MVCLHILLALPFYLFLHFKLEQPTLKAFLNTNFLEFSKNVKAKFELTQIFQN